MSIPATIALTQIEQPDMFVCNLASWPVKDDMGSMDVPIFSLSRYGDTKIRHYQRGNKALTEVTGMDNHEKHAYLEAIRKRYCRAKRVDKGTILDESRLHHQQRADARHAVRG